MSNEIISISSSDGDDSTIKEVLPALPVKAEPSEVGTLSTVVNRINHTNNLNTFLRSKPHCFAKQTKHSAECMKKYEYRVCGYSCSFCLNFIYDLTNKTVPVKETALPPSHVTTGDAITSSHIHITSEVLRYIDFFANQNLFTPNFGKVVHALQDEFMLRKYLFCLILR
jgi:hypothetical protein